MTASTAESANGGRACAVDVAAGVERLMGDRGLYMRVLQRFCSDFRGTPDEIRTALAAGDDTHALRLAHTLKGASGMIDAQALHGRALVLEQALRARPGDCGSEIEAVQAELQRVLAEAPLLLAASEPSTGVGSASPAPGNAVARLRELLDLGDGAAVHLVHGARAELVGVLGDDCYRELVGTVDRFDFVGALRLMGKPGSAF